MQIFGLRGEKLGGSHPVGKWPGWRRTLKPGGGRDEPGERSQKRKVGNGLGPSADRRLRVQNLIRAFVSPLE